MTIFFLLTRVRPKIDIAAYERMDLKLPEREALVAGTENLNRYLNILPTRSTLVWM